MILPSGYKRLLYIESSGTQYVDTGITSNANTSVRFRAQTVTADNSTILLGSYGGTAASEMVAFYIYNGKYYYKRGGSNYTIPTSADTNIHSITWQSGSVIIDGTSYAMDGGGVATRPFYLFAHNNNGTAGLFAKARLYSCLFYDGSQLIRNFIPCQTDTGEIGLYDTVGGQFYGNKGTGVFVAGPEWSYDELEYIESSGTQYIDTGFNVSSANLLNLTLEIDQQINSGTHISVSGSGTSAPIFYIGTIGGAIYYGNGTTDTTIGKSYDYTRRTFVVSSYQKKVSVSGIGEVAASFNVPSGNKNLFLFGFNNGDSVGLHSAKIYGCKIYVGTECVRDFIPAKLSDGSIGLIDKLTEEFYPNMGTGTFLAGNVKPSRYIELEYIQSSGTQYIDTGFKQTNNSRIVVDAQLVTPGTVSVLFGSRDASKTKTMDLFWYNGVWNADFYDEPSRKTFAIGATERIHADFNKNVLTLNGISQTYTNYTFQCEYPQYLFAMNEANTGRDMFNFAGKLFSYQAYDNDTLIRDYIPIKLTDGTVGLLDKVSGFFYGNAGTGAFAAGPAIATEYTKLEYVESTGEQYIDTQFIPASGATAELAFESTAVDASVESWVAGVFDLSVSGYPRMRAGLVNGAYYTADTNGFTYNGTPGEYTVATGGVSKAGCTLSLYLFAQHEAANGAAHMANSKYRLYGAKFFVSGVLAMDLIPAIANGVPGMVDQLNNRFYPSSTAVMLVAGPVLAYPPSQPEGVIAPYSDFANILLVWPVVPNAEGYNLLRNGELIATTQYPFYFDSGLDVQTEYSYSLTAFNASGESEPAEITASTTEFKLVTDRTAADVQAVLAGNLDSLAWYAGMKGAYNATDLNRVEAAVLFVIERLRIAGWYLEAQTKHWTFADFPTASEMQRYLDNVRLLRSALPVGLPMVPSDMNLFRYDEANTIESILERLDVAVTNIMQNVYYSSEIYSGEVR